MRELKITNMTYCRDMHYINKMNDEGLYDLAKSNASDAVLDCINGLDEVIKECWQIYKNPDTTTADKLSALRTLTEMNDRKYAMFQEGSEMLGKYHHDHDLT